MDLDEEKSEYRRVEESVMFSKGRKNLISYLLKKRSRIFFRISHLKIVRLDGKFFIRIFYNKIHLFNFFE